MKIKLLEIKKKVNSFLTKSKELSEKEIISKSENLLALPESSITEMAKFFKNYDYVVAELEAKIKPTVDKIKELKAIQENSKVAIKHLMVKHDFIEVPSLEASVRLNKCPISCEIVDEAKVPEKYFKTVKKFDKKLLKKDFKECDKEVSGVEFVVDKTTLKIT